MTEFQAPRDLLAEGTSLIPGTLMERLDITWIDIQVDRVVATMPVAAATRQPFGLLHGGATAALIESAASMGAVVGAGDAIPLCTKISVEHLRVVRDGAVTATAVRRKDDDDLVWDVDVIDDTDHTIARGECTFVVRSKT